MLLKTRKSRRRTAGGSDPAPVHADHADAVVSQPGPATEPNPSADSEHTLGPESVPPPVWRDDEGRLHVLI